MNVLVFCCISARCINNRYVILQKPYQNWNKLKQFCLIVYIIIIKKC